MSEGNAEVRGPNAWIALSAGIATVVGVSIPNLSSLQQEPAYALGVLVAGVAGGAVTSVGAGLWEKWRPGLVDRIECNTRWLFQRPRTRYLQWVTFRFRDFDVKGLTTQGKYNLDLASVFVDLALAPVPLHEATANPVAETAQSSTDAESVGAFRSFLATTDRLAIVGPPGSGKTTLFRYTALALAGPHAAEWSRFLTVRTPVILNLLEVAKSFKGDATLPLPTVLSEALGAANVDVAWVVGEVRAGRCLVMLDGLDEVADPAVRVRVAKWVEEQVAALPGNRWVVSSRPQGFQSAQVAGFALVGVQPMSRSQVHQFLANWYLANEARASQRLDEGVRMNAQRDADDLARRIDKSEDLVRLAVNPLLPFLSS